MCDTGKSVLIYRKGGTMSRSVPSPTIHLTSVSVLACVWALMSTAIGAASTLYVCADGSGDYTTIQAAIDAANDGDVIVLCDGVYAGTGNKNISFGGKSVTLRSENGSANCIIDLEGDGRAFFVYAGEDSTTTIEGITIRNGFVDDWSPGGSNGGAIYCESTSP